MKLLMIILCMHFLIVPVSALEIQAPEVPKAGQQWMPECTDSFADGLLELMENVSDTITPDLQEASEVCVGIIAAVLLTTLVQSISSETKMAVQIAGTVAVAAILLLSSNTMIRLASDTILEIGEYGKLLLPVMTSALAAQGGVSSSAVLYAGTAMFLAFLQSAMGKFLVPGIYLYLALSTGNGATGEDLLKNMSELLKGILTWFLKILLMIFTTFLSLSGVISGTTDVAALKAAKVAASSFIPVVGSILSDASEAVLVSAGLIKNAAGIYGILAVLALFLRPFLRIGIQYLMLKLTGVVCSVFSEGRITTVIQSFSSAMGILLGMTAAACMMVLISTVCFLKGVG